MDYPTLFFSVVVAIAAVWAVASFAARLGFPLPDNRIGCIDGLRGAAALSVMVHHLVIWMQVSKGGEWEAPPVDLLNNLGIGAVSLFFMTTGLLFFPQVLKGWGLSWPRLWVGRVFRLVPLIVVSTVLICVVIAVRTGARPSLDDLRPFAKWVLTIEEPALLGEPDSGRMNAHVLWSLKWEWVFYLLVLPACALARGLLLVLPGPAWMRGFVARTWIVPVALLVGSLPLRGAVEVAQFLPLFAIGMLAWEAKERFAILGQPRMALPALACLFVAMVNGSPFNLLNMALYGLFFACVAAGAGFGVLNTRAAKVLGECSFGIYLLHGLPLYLLFDGGPKLWLPAILPVAAVAVVLAAAAAFLLVESPMHKLGRALSAPRKVKPLERAAVADA